MLHKYTGQWPSSLEVKDSVDDEWQRFSVTLFHCTPLRNKINPIANLSDLQWDENST